ncbi:TPA: hypothetical protein HA249_03090 [Candidatus Woesearchaeota archaeon]|nr:hypothetical protein [Candidatus Woesearchaeota archaeon]
MVDLESHVERFWITPNQLYDDGYALGRRLWDEGVHPTHLLALLKHAPVALPVHGSLKLHNGAGENDDATKIKHGVIDPADPHRYLDGVGEGDHVLVIGDVADKGSEMRTVSDAVRTTGAEVVSAVLYARPETGGIDFVGQRLAGEVVFPHQMHIRDGEEERRLTQQEAEQHRPALFEDRKTLFTERVFAHDPDTHTNFEFRDADKVYAMAYHLARKIKREIDRYRIPHEVVSVWRGGAPVGAVVAETLKYFGYDLPHHHVLKAESYTDRASGSLEIKGFSALASKLRKGQTILLIDELMDSGQTLGILKQEFQKVVGKEGRVYLAVIDWKSAKNETGKTFGDYGFVPYTEPEFYLNMTTRWIVAPHELEPEVVPRPLLEKHHFLAKYLPESRV